MSLIEKAAERLEKLKQAGKEPPHERESKAATREAEPGDAGSSAASLDATGGGSRATPAGAITAAHVPERGRGSQEVTLDLTALHANGFVTPVYPHSSLAEDFRIIKRPLLRNVQGRGAAPLDQPNLILITSALPREGKTFSSINLAMSIAMELDHTVLLVDADVSRPAMHNYLGLPARKGLMDLLSGEVDNVSDVMLRTNVEKLSLLPAGMPHPRATELLASDAMERLLAEMATRYSERVIIFDSPPLLVTTEAQALATHMGQVVLVVEADNTPRGSVIQALEAIETCPVRMTMLNKTRGGMLSGGYGYGYGYGHDYRAAEAAGNNGVKAA